MGRIRVLVVDDHRIFAESLAAALAAEPDVEVSAAGNESAARRCLERASADGRRFDVLLVDADLGAAGRAASSVPGEPRAVEPTPTSGTAAHHAAMPAAQGSGLPATRAAGTEAAPRGTASRDGTARAHLRGAVVRGSAVQLGGAALAGRSAGLRTRGVQESNAAALGDGGMPQPHTAARMNGNSTGAAAGHATADGAPPDGAAGREPAVPDGISLVERVRAEHPAMRIVVLADRDDPARAARALQAGASGWVAKDCSLSRLLAVVRGVLRDETHLPPALLTGVLKELTTARRHRTESERLVESLTPREQEVLRCMVAGLGRKAVAERLYLSPHTVRTHMQNVLGKLGVHSTLAAVALARRAGIGPIDLEPAGHRSGD